MRFSTLFAAAIPLLGSALAAPINAVGADALYLKRDIDVGADVAGALSLKRDLLDIDADAKAALNVRDVDYVSVLQNLESTVGSITTLAANATEDEVTEVLTTVNDALTTALSDLGLSSSSKRSERLVARDLTDDVSELLATVIQDVDTIVAPLEDTLSSIPAVKALLDEVNTALSSIVTGLDEILGGVLTLVSNILSGLGIDLTPLLSGVLGLLTGVLGGL
ncbi:hypothetical protein L198_04381 [Cryptococcus wingfieldii CBS 7118]|uniref:DUF6987 domain-containing protein n=1 Tax=Cryptococcus wingfieldii CBS 7118 TaxID=1295528 RepID=A0A1E3J4J5_9TREE|nr:hypothetical protein L198_04381 [Cryptococcus wingfieldii CBS 7118]ODN95763.1 hypothetical protein L198_04381 [Cryptococcus wingfieldii CBS 7118]